MRKFIGLTLILGLGLTALAAIPAAANNGGQPTGQGATACHLLADTYTSTGPGDVDFAAKINVGNPVRVMLAGDCDGGAVEPIDDDLRLATSRPNGVSASATWTIAVCTVSNDGLAAQDVTELFQTGSHHVTLTVLDTCGGLTELLGPVYLIVQQQAD